MNGAVGHDSVLQGYTGPRTTWANEMYESCPNKTRIHSINL